MNSDKNNDAPCAKREWQAYLFTILFLFPILSVIFVGGYGFIIWMLQVFFLGPPGHG
ncbi:periplasmic nitrate reductase, NapE protein [Thaumasiovibrio sp. DFM-14]|uniref:periplasmic nitrate reductase, NapE protein n=1 Tax=Thaumasiovibrio sp. DFM-14 TaxID=3384792 RepID=UPI00399FC68A